jgi:hypothetical protein
MSVLARAHLATENGGSLAVGDRRQASRRLACKPAAVVLPVPVSPCRQDCDLITEKGADLVECDELFTVERQQASSAVSPAAQALGRGGPSA